MVNVLGVGEDRQYAYPIGYWTVDGQALGEWLARWSPEGPRANPSGVLRISAPADLRALLGRISASLPSGRVPLYVCSQCGDLGCGAFTVRVTHDESVGIVKWSDFAWERDAAPELEPDTDFEDVPDLHFDQRAYDELIEALLDSSHNG